MFSLKYVSLTFACYRSFNKSLDLWTHVQSIVSMWTTTASLSASLAQGLEYWSCKPGVESSNLSRGRNFFLLSRLMHKRYLNIFFPPEIRAFCNQSDLLLIFLASDSFHLFSQVVSIYFFWLLGWSTGLVNQGPRVQISHGAVDRFSFYFYWWSNWFLFFFVFRLIHT